MLFVSVLLMIIDWLIAESVKLEFVSVLFWV